MGKYFLTLSISAAFIGLSACSGADEPDPTPAASPTSEAPAEAPAPTTEEPTTEEPTTEEPTTEEATTEAAAEDTAAEDAEGSTEDAGDAGEIEEPEGSALLLSAVLPEKVGDYEGQEMTTDKLGDGQSVQWQYTRPSDSLLMTLVPTTVEYTTLVNNFDDTGEAFGEIATCGYIYGNESTPACMIKVENGTTLTAGGDSDSTLDQVKAFTSEFLSLVDTQ